MDAVQAGHGVDEGAVARLAHSPGNSPARGLTIAERARSIERARSMMFAEPPSRRAAEPPSRRP